MLNHPNRVDQARELYARFTGVISPEILQPFVYALAHSNHPAQRFGGAKHPWDWTFVYGEDPSNPDELIFLPLVYAIELGRHETALNLSESFAELKAIDEGAYYSVVSSLTDGADYPELENFMDSDECYAECPADRSDFKNDAEREQFEVEYEERYAAYVAEAAEEYKSLSHYGSRPPEDEDEFDATEYMQWCFDYGYRSGSPDPKKEMHGLVPDAVESLHGKLENGVHDGPYVTYRKENLKSILGVFDELGFIVVNDEYLINATYWGAGDKAAFEKRVAWYRSVEEMLEGGD